ncbi:MAG: chromosome partitioning protein ParB [Kofleriaceae bacterium]|nr:MAG: chromosome partitioning protein ParB [Kofleriaceae bacterium]MBZ0232198.1 chromosome partitioning protein ParB [Kofleriaceae bacterium]
MAEAKKKAVAKKPAGEKKPRASKKPRAAPGSAGIAATEAVDGAPPSEITAVEKQIADAGGAVIGHYREPLGGHWCVFAMLPLDQVEPTPYQRELSKAHAERLATVIPKVGRFLDPIVTVPTPEGFRSPNGMHRISAMRTLGAKAITALVVPDPEVAFRILALNTEKAHNLRDKSLEVVRMVRALVADGVNGKRPYSDFQLELESPAFLTIGVCYEQNGRYSGGAYLSVVNKCEEWSDRPLKEVLAVSEKHAERLLELDELVNAAVAKLKAQGFQSGYLKPVVVARINPLRWIKAKPGQPIKAEFDKTIDKMIESARSFDASKVKESDIAAAAAMGGSAEE